MLNLDPLESHARVWARIKPALEKHRLPHALLFVAPRHAKVLSFAHRLMAILLCHHSEATPCGLCQACHLLVQGTHPDIRYVHQDTLNGPIKIEQIRELQHDVYHTPQLGLRRFIVIEPADKLNAAAANALLKILEEPPAHTAFILIAEQTRSLPATLMSRCQQYLFTSQASLEGPNNVDYLAMGHLYPDDSARGQLFQQRDVFIAALRDMAAGKTSPCTIAAQWSGYALGDLLWFLHLLTAQSIRDQLQRVQLRPPLTPHPSPMALFQQLDRINALMRQVQQNITLNQTLAIEGLLMGYLS